MAVGTASARRRIGSMHVLVIAVVGLALVGGTLRSFVAGTPDVATAATVFCGIFVQALPFLALGVLISGAVAAFVTPDRLARWVPKRPAAAILAAGVGGAALPGCECGSVPVARRLFGEGTVGAAIVGSTTDRMLGRQPDKFATMTRRHFSGGNFWIGGPADDAGVVDQYVQQSELADGGIHGSRPLLGISHVEAHVSIVFRRPPTLRSMSRKSPIKYFGAMNGVRRTIN